MSEPIPPSGSSPQPGSPQPMGQPANTTQSMPAQRKSGGIGKGLIAGLAALVALVLIGAGAFAFSKLGGGGSKADEYLPGNAIGAMSVDLDPNVFQKKDAKDFLDKFPAAKKELEPNKYDLRKVIWEKTTADNAELPKWSEVEKWVGNRAGLAVLQGDKEPDAVAVLEVKDVGKAKAEINKAATEAKSKAEDKLSKFDSSGLSSSSKNKNQVGMADRDKWLYVAFAEDQGKAQQIAEKVRDDAKNNPLSKKDSFKEDMKGLDNGIINAWVDLSAVGDAITKSDEMAKSVGASSEAMNKLIKDNYKGHMAMTVRFVDGNALEMVGNVNGMNAAAGKNLGNSTVDLNVPDNAVAAVAVSGLGEGVAQAWPQLMDAFKTMQGTSGGQDPQQLEQELEKQLGISLPEDLKTLLGDQLSGALMLDGEQPTGGIRVTGKEDPNPVLDKLFKNLGADTSKVTRKKIDNGYVLAVDEKSGQALVDGGKLKDKDAFKKAVPDAGKAGAVVYVDIATLMDKLGSSADQEAKDWLGPLQSMGMSSWKSGDNGGGFKMRLTTK